MIPSKDPFGNRDADQRPDPDELLRRLNADEQQKKRGKLKIFFGSCPGVGKTYAMLVAAHARLKEGVDVVAGVIETHQRPETLKLLEGLPVLPLLTFEHRGLALKDFDLDAAKLRRPSLILMDELAHTNAPEMRHPKRWNDVEELLDAGIDVYTTLNVQHIESLSDVVAGTTGVWVKETVPDAIFDHANDIILVDINIDELLKRLAEGRVYIAPEVRARALEHFFQVRNLNALREIALRRTAERVDAQIEDLHPAGSAETIFPVADRIMVCIGPDPLSAPLVRAAKRMATSLKAPWVAVYVENMRHFSLNRPGQQNVARMARLAERMGGKSAILQGDNVVDDIISYAKRNRITKIVVGKPIKAAWRTLVFGSLADKIIRRSDHIDVYVVSGKAPSGKPVTGKNKLSVFRPDLYTWAFLTAAALTLLGVALNGVIAPIDQALIYMMGVILVASRFGRGPSFLYSFLSVTCFNFFFIPPIYSFNIYDRSYWLTFAVMLATALVITNQASRLRLQALFSRKRERDTQTFYDMTRELAATRGHANIAKVAAKHIGEMFGVTAIVSLPDGTGQVLPVIGQLPLENLAKEQGVLQWCFANSQTAGRYTTAMPSAQGLYLPLIASSGTLGVLGVVAFAAHKTSPSGEPVAAVSQLDADREFTSEEMASLETCASLLASALERANTADVAESAKIEAEGERLRTMLLSSVSHDLRTPLASITGASSTIMTDQGQLSRETVRELGRSINTEAERLSHLVTNLLEVTRLEAGGIDLNTQPYFIDELIGSSLARIPQVLEHHKVTATSEEGLPLVLADGILIEQLLINLLENAAHYTPDGSEIHISAERQGDMVAVTVADNGPGIPSGFEEKIFDKFYSLGRSDGKRGTGLGLAICAGIIKAHGGAIKVSNLPKGGASFTFTLSFAPPPSAETPSPEAPQLEATK